MPFQAASVDDFWERFRVGLFCHFGAQPPVNVTRVSDQCPPPDVACDDVLLRSVAVAQWVEHPAAKRAIRVRLPLGEDQIRDTVIFSGAVTQVWVEGGPTPWVSTTATLKKTPLEMSSYACGAKLVGSGEPRVPGFAPEVSHCRGYDPCPIPSLNKITSLAYVCLTCECSQLTLSVIQCSLTLTS